MKNPSVSTQRFRRGFTLVELLVVIAIMAILAALIIPMAGVVSRKKTIAMAQADMGKLETAIEAYKTKMGFYPPGNSQTATDDPDRPSAARNQLFYELTGTTFDGNQSFTDAMGGIILRPNIQTFFGAGVDGFANAATDPGEVRKFLRSWRGSDVGNINTIAQPVQIFVLPVSGSPQIQAYQGTDRRWLTPWSYDPSSTNRINAESYDLWMDIVLGGKTNRICNWSEQPILLK